MRCFLTLILGLVLFSQSQNASTQTHNDAFSSGQEYAAHKICLKLSFSTKEECLSTIRGYYFDKSAVDTCDQATFSQKKIDCLKVIRGKHYEKYELQTCNNERFWNSKLECLKESGIFNRNPNLDPRVTAAKRSVTRALHHLRNNNQSSAILELEQLLNFLEN